MLLLRNLCGFQASALEDLPDAADIPVLGLSNKAIQAAEDVEPVALADQEQNGYAETTPDPHTLTLDLDKPPFEDHLSRSTLWPENEKLYGHGYEISAVAASHDGSLIATACRASSINHAVIRVYETSDWREIKPPLAAHSLTVTRLRFADDDQYLLSVGRDRQWAVFERDQNQFQLYALTASNLKAHSRMIMDAAWGPDLGGRVFATAGRDKSVKLWQGQGRDFLCKAVVAASQSVTGVAFLPKILEDNIYIAFGTETGIISINGFTRDALSNGLVYVFDPK